WLAKRKAAVASSWSNIGSAISAPARTGAVTQPHDETALVQPAERVIGEQTGVHVAGPFAPLESLGRRDALDHLHHAPLVHGVLGPHPRILLLRCHLTERDIAGLWKPPEPIPVRVARRVGDNR